MIVYIFLQSTLHSPYAPTQLVSWGSWGCWGEVVAVSLFGPFGADAGVSLAGEEVASSYSLRNRQIVGDDSTNETCVGVLEIDRPCNAILIRFSSPIIRTLLYAKH